MKRFRMTAATLGLLSACLVPSMRADDSNKETHLTINQPLQIRDTVLAPGQYVFKLAEPDTDHSVVGVYNADSNQTGGIHYGLAGVPNRCRRQTPIHDFSTRRESTSQTANPVLPW
jgi:hypothetical protein